MDWDRFNRLALSRGGIVRIVPTAAAAGMHPGTVQRRARREGWWCPHPGVVALPGVPREPRTRALAAVRYLEGASTSRVGDPSPVGVTRWTAVHLLGLGRSAPSRVQVLVSADRHPQARPGIEVVRGRGLTPSDLWCADGVDLVRPERLLRDLAPVCDDASLRAVAIDLLHARHVRSDDMRAALSAWPTFPGRGRLRRVIEDLEAAGRTDSPLEFTGRQRLGDAGIHLDRGQVAVPVRGGRAIDLDLGIRSIRLAIEVNSFGFHSHRTDVTRDAWRANAIARAEDDWRILELTWDMLGEDWPRFVAELREAIAIQSLRHLGKPWPGPEDLA